MTEIEGDDLSDGEHVQMNVKKPDVSVFAEAIMKAVFGPLLKEIQTYRLDRARQGKLLYV